MQDVDLWEDVLTELDYHAHKWYRRDERLGWVEIEFRKVHELLRNIGVGGAVQFNEGKPVEDPDREYVVKRMMWRDGEAHPRDKKKIQEAQMRLGL